MLRDGLSRDQRIERAIAEKRYCRDCRAAGMIHCAHPNECGMLDGIDNPTQKGQVE
jgi:hypothetical protein